MKIALIGYGKMGRQIEQAAIQRGHEIVARIDRSAKRMEHSAEIFIDFSHPDAIEEHMHLAGKFKKNLVVGTTGWEARLQPVKELVEKYQIGMLYSPNFSLGVHLFLKLLENAAILMQSFNEYDIGITESHHKKKLDSPSGTAKAIAKILKQPSESVSSLRCGHIFGTHHVLFDSPVDNITLTHEAKNREGFALGAVKAAEWLEGKKGFFTIDDLLKDLI